MGSKPVEAKDFGQFGGTASWVEPELSQRVMAYEVYLAASPTGIWRMGLSSRL